MKSWIRKFKFSSTKSTYFKVHFVLLFVITLITLIRSLLHIFLPDGGAGVIATIPLENYSEPAQATIVSMFAFWGLSQTMVAVVMIIVLWKMPQSSPLLYVLIAFEYLSRILIGLYKPFETIQTAPGVYGNYLLLFIALGALLIHFIRND
jgi:hypothetical protein